LLFFLKKTGYASLVLLGVTCLVFILFQGFGDPARLVAGQAGDQKTMQQIRKSLHLDQPRWKQLLFYINDVSPICIHPKNDIEEKKLKGLFIGNNLKFGIKYPFLGKSYQSKQNVDEILGEALPGTIVLALAAIIFALTGGLLLGMIAAVYRGKWPDHLAITASIAGTSFPSFFVAIVLAYLIGILWHQYSGLMPNGSLFAINEVSGRKYLEIKNLILPAVTLGLRPLAIITQLTRSSLIEVMQQDYIRTGFAKGLSKTSVMMKHALPNAFNPVLSATTGWFAEMLAGSFFIEYIFGWKGIGKVTVDALEKLDYPVVMGAVLLSATLFTLINFLSDVLFRMADKRIQAHS
jgi:peptide/nickel transport system permease protein